MDMILMTLVVVVVVPSLQHVVTIPTYNLTLKDGTVWVDPDANEPGTFVEPVEVPA